MSNTSHILVVDDDDDLRTLVASTIERAGHRVSQADDGRAALQLLFTQRPDLVVLDLSMPGTDGWTTLERVRELSADIPVLMLTGQDEELVKVRALRAGADDYLTKPFGRQELVARVDALLRRAARSTDGAAAAEAYDDGCLKVDLRDRTASVDGTEMALTPLEFRLLTTFVRHPNQVLSADQLLSMVWNDSDGDGRDRVKVYVGYLRGKLAEAGVEDAVETVRGFGYRFRPPAPG